MPHVRRLSAILLVLITSLLCASTPLGAHALSSKDAQYLQLIDGAAIIPLMYLGAKEPRNNKLVVVG